VNKDYQPCGSHAADKRRDERQARRIRYDHYNVAMPDTTKERYQKGD
jgi:hypothetical protein